jgi:hypothetical protein
MIYFFRDQGARHMTTRLDLRTSLRERLEDTGSAPLWSDAVLNAWLGDALRQYGVQIPVQATVATAPVTAGDLTITLPAGVTAEGVGTVRNAAGATVPRGDDRVPDSAPGQSWGAVQGWSAWGDTLRLRCVAAGANELGPWSIDYAAGRELIGNDLDPQPVVAGDEPVIVALAAAMALDQRAVERGKRGDTMAAREMRASAEGARGEAATLLAARRRRPRSGFLQVDGAA